MNSNGGLGALANGNGHEKYVPRQISGDVDTRGRRFLSHGIDDDAVLVIA